MSFFNTVKKGISKSIDNHLQKRREEQETLKQLKKEVELEERRLYLEQLKKNSLEVARAKAYKDASKHSGLQKLRAVNRARNMSNSNLPPGSFFSRLSEYTKKNIARREENLKKVAEMRALAEEMKREKLQKNISPNINRPSRLSNCKWKM